MFSDENQRLKINYVFRGICPGDFFKRCLSIGSRALSLGSPVVYGVLLIMYIAVFSRWWLLKMCPSIEIITLNVVSPFVYGIVQMDCILVHLASFNRMT